jgi:hypothetical protein
VSVNIRVAGTEIDIEALPCRREPTRKNRIGHGARLRVGQVSAVIKAFQLPGSEISSGEKSEKVEVRTDSSYISVILPCFYCGNFQSSSS